MKKYLLTIFMALIIGLFLCKSFLGQYKSSVGIKVNGTSDTLYFIQYGVYSSLDSLEENTINLQNYIYSTYDNLYYVYVGITKDYENATKIVNYYKELGSDTIVKEYSVSNKSFLDELDNYDLVLKDTTDTIVISSIISQVLTKYEEVVINGS